MNVHFECGGVNDNTVECGMKEVAFASATCWHVCATLVCYDNRALPTAISGRFRILIHSCRRLARSCAGMDDRAKWPLQREGASLYDVLWSMTDAGYEPLLAPCSAHAATEGNHRTQGVEGSMWPRDVRSATGNRRSTCRVGRVRMVVGDPLAATYQSDPSEQQANNDEGREWRQGAGSRLRRGSPGISHVSCCAVADLMCGTSAYRPEKCWKVEVRAPPFGYCAAGTAIDQVGRMRLGRVHEGVVVLSKS